MSKYRFLVQCCCLWHFMTFVLKEYIKPILKVWSLPLSNSRHLCVVTDVWDVLVRLKQTFLCFSTVSWLITCDLFPWFLASWLLWQREECHEKWASEAGLVSGKDARVRRRSVGQRQWGSLLFNYTLWESPSSDLRVHTLRPRAHRAGFWPRSGWCSNRHLHKHRQNSLAFIYLL